MNKTLLIILGILVLIILAAVSSYNGLIGSSQAVDAFVGSGPERLPAPRRPDPKPCTDRAGSGQLREIDDRAGHRGPSLRRQGADRPEQAPADAAQLARYQQAQGQLGTALFRLLVVAENYPDLKASANFRDLQAQLEGTENRITVERGRFDQAVQTYNTKIKTLPTVFSRASSVSSPSPTSRRLQVPRAPPR